MATKLTLPGGELELRSPGDLSKDPETRLTYNRAKFSLEYAQRKDWPLEREKLSFDQIEEICSQPEWQHAQLLSYEDPPVETVRVPTMAEVAQEIEKLGPPTGDDLTRLADYWGIERGEMGDEELRMALRVAMSHRTDFPHGVVCREDIENYLLRMEGIDRVRVFDERDSEDRVPLFYQGEIEPEDVRELLRLAAPVTLGFAVKRVEEWPGEGAD